MLFLISTYFRFQYWLHGPEPAFFHVLNVLLHVLNTCLLGHVTLYVFRLGEQIMFLTSLLFAAHPIHVEAVSRRVCFKDSTTFSLCVVEIETMYQLFCHNRFSFKKSNWIESDVIRFCVSIWRKGSGEISDI